ncbi:protein TolR [Stappia sp.]|jgi:biopolymer transport protein TolR|uniref:protein TolR n=1 Tax=Stappia sp. TaxID=1870903 RepID=UPI003A998DCD
MGMQMGGGREASGGRRRRRRSQPMSEINVTPFVDVMLVLLIIFMVAAPLLTVGVPLDLPETQAKPLDGVSEPISVSVAADGRVYIQETEIDPEELIAKLEAIAKGGYEERIFVRGDANTDYGTIMKVMARISAAGYKRLALVTLEEQQ